METVRLLVLKNVLQFRYTLQTKGASELSSLKPLFSKLGTTYSPIGLNSSKGQSSISPLASPGIPIKWLIPQEMHALWKKWLCCNYDEVYTFGHRSKHN